MNHLASFSVSASYIKSSLIFSEKLKKRMLCATILHGALRVIIYSNIQINIFSCFSMETCFGYSLESPHWDSSAESC